MFKFILIIFYILLAALNYWLPNIVFKDSSVFIFALISVQLLKEFDWMLLKRSCKNSKDKFCKIFKKIDKKDGIELYSIKEFKPNENEEKSIKEKVLENV